MRVSTPWRMPGTGPRSQQRGIDPDRSCDQRERPAQSCRNGTETLILDAHKLAHPDGELVFVQSSMADIPRSIQLMTECGMIEQVVGQTRGPFRDYYHEDAAFMREIAKIPGGYTLRDGRYYERLIVFRATLDASQAQR